VLGHIQSLSHCNIPPSQDVLVLNVLFSIVHNSGGWYCGSGWYYGDGLFGGIGFIASHVVVDEITL
jgi:hypothetical protein